MTGKRLWYLVIIVFFLHQLLEKVLHVHFRPADNYLDPFLSIPFLLGAYTYGNPILGIDTILPRLKLWEVMAVAFVFAIFFEEGFPRMSSHFHRDKMDCLMYGLGGLFYYYFVQGIAPKKS